jgi:hypothetical protein
VLGRKTFDFDAILQIKPFNYWAFLRVCDRIGWATMFPELHLRRLLGADAGSYGPSQFLSAFSATEWQKTVAHGVKPWEHDFSAAKLRSSKRNGA